MDIDKLLYYLSIIQNSDFSVRFAKSIEKELLTFGPIHPALNSQLAVIYVSNGMVEIAYEKYKSIVRDEIESGFKNYNTAQSDIAGISAAYLVLNLFSQSDDDSGKYDLFLFAYLYLSSNIKFGGDLMCDSFKNRAYISDKFSNYIQGLGVKYLLSNFFIPIPCTIGDYYYAAVGYKSYGVTESLNECMERADYLHQYLEDIMIGGKDADEYDLVEMAELGRERTDSILEEISNLSIIDSIRLLKLLS